MSELLNGKRIGFEGWVKIAGVLIMVGIYVSTVQGNSAEISAIKADYVRKDVAAEQAKRYEELLQGIKAELSKINDKLERRVGPAQLKEGDRMQ